MRTPRAHRRPVLAQLALALGLLLSCGFAQANNGTCLFAARGTMTLGFGTIDPSSTTNAVATLTPGAVAQIGDCKGVTMTVTADNGSNYNGSRQLADAARANFIAYSLTLPAPQPGPGNNRYVPLVITGTITPASFQNAPAGAYSDSVVITVSP